MNISIFYLIACSGSIILSKAYGRKIHTRNPAYDYQPSSFTENSKHKLKHVHDIYSDSKNNDNPTLTNHLFKLNFQSPKELQSNRDDNESSFYPSTSDSNKRKSLSMEIGKHLVRVTSALKDGDLKLKQSKNGGYDISVNPKFSHVIEILPIGKDDPEHELTSKNPEEYEKFDQKPDTEELTKTESAIYTEKNIQTEGYSDAEETITTKSAPLTGEPISNERAPFIGETFSTARAPVISETFLTARAPVIDETFSTARAPVIDETFLTTRAPVISETFSTERAPVVDEAIRTKNIPESDKAIDNERDINSGEMGIDFRSGSQLQGSEFESEGSGEDIFSQSAEEDQSSKSGRVLGMFSRQNATAPSCTTPKGESGQCRRIRQCLLSDAVNNFNVFLQHLCLIRGALVGICCPSNPVIEISNPDEANSTDNTFEPDIKQPPEGCGLNTKTRIVGGSISVPHEWTWMVALLRRNRFYCGGVIINNWYVLTAAHCVMGIDVKDITVRLGEYDFNTHNRHQEDITISDIKRHAQFVTLTFQHDIALLKLKRSIQYSKFVGSICLPNLKARDYSDVNGTVVGWGTVSFGGAASPILRQVTVPVWKNEDCDRTYSLETINESFLCAGSPDTGEDACQGDSGGPLMAVNSRGRWEVIGLVSWGRRCGDPTYPGVYTRVTTYLDWINENVN